jgi:hypothetical protein
MTWCVCLRKPDAFLGNIDWTHGRAPLPGGSRCAAPRHRIGEGQKKHGEFVVSVVFLGLLGSGVLVG